jgi:hypothetical protein
MVRHRKLVWFCLLASVVGFWLALWGRDGTEPRPREWSRPIAASISFQSCSNSLSGQKWAVLSVTNRESDNLYVCGHFSVELSDQPGFLQDSHWRTPNFVLARSSATVAVEIPPAPGTWRARLMLTRFTWRDRVRNVFPSRYPDRLIPVRRTFAERILVTDRVPQ